MKRSEFLARIKHGTRPSNQGETVFNYFARESVLAAEAAGVVWDPEEELLPERVSLNPDEEVCLGGTPIHVLRGRAFRLWKIEAVRRYNAWTELEKLLSDMESGNWADGKPLWRLRNILRGAPQC